MNMNYFLGVDAGGTKTKAVLIDDEAKILGVGNAGSANYHNIGLEKATSSVIKAINEACSEAKINLADVNWCAVGIAACDTPKDHERLFGAFSSGALQALVNKLTVVNDTKIGLYSGTLPPGIVVICGTGCNVYGKNDHGEGAMSGNWGHFLGDRGSGYQLAKWTFQAVVSAYDGTGEATLLTKKFEDRLKIKSVKDLVDWYNDKKPSIHEISDFAPLALAAAEEGDEIARQLVDRTIAELGKALMAVVRKLKMEEEFNRVVIVGGLFESKYFRALFEGHATALLKKVRIVKPLVPAEVGAAIMARQEWQKVKKEA